MKVIIFISVGKKKKTAFHLVFLQTILSKFCFKRAKFFLPSTLILLHSVANADFLLELALGACQLCVQLLNLK